MGMVVDDFTAKRGVSFKFISAGGGCIAMALTGLLLAVFAPEASWWLYVKLMPFMFLLGFGLVALIPFGITWRVYIAQLTADAAEHEARGKKALLEVSNTVATVVTATPEPVAQVIKRSVPIYSNGRHTSDAIIEETIGVHHAAWLSAAINFVRAADHLNSLLCGEHIAFSVSDPNAWQAITDALAESGYIVKGNGRATKLHPDWSYAGIMAALNNGGRLVHPDAPPPLVKVFRGGVQ